MGDSNEYESTDEMIGEETWCSCAASERHSGEASSARRVDCGRREKDKDREKGDDG